MYFLKAKLKWFGRKARPSRAFTSALLSKLEPVASYRQHAFRFATAGMAAVLVIFGTGTSVYAYSSPDVSDGHPLYPIKHGMEQLQERFAATSDQRAEFHADMMQRRMAEAERLDQTKEQIPKILESAASELDLSVNELKADLRDPEQRKEVIDRLSETNERYADVLSRVPKAMDRPEMTGRPDGLRREPPSPEGMRARLKMLRDNRQESSP